VRPISTRSPRLRVSRLRPRGTSASLGRAGRFSQIPNCPFRSGRLQLQIGPSLHFPTFAICSSPKELAMRRFLPWRIFLATAIAVAGGCCCPPPPRPYWGCNCPQCGTYQAAPFFNSAYTYAPNSYPQLTSVPPLFRDAGNTKPSTPVSPAPPPLTPLPDPNLGRSPESKTKDKCNPCISNCPPGKDRLKISGNSDSVVAYDEDNGKMFVWQKGWRQWEQIPCFPFQ
jgi:hypothetical protein